MSDFEKMKTVLPPFMHVTEGRPSWKQQFYVIPLELSQYVLQNKNLLLVQNKSTEQPLIYVYNSGVYQLCSDDRAREIIIDCYKIPGFDTATWTKIEDINKALAFIKTDSRYYRKMDELNSDEEIINFQNGILRFKEGEWNLEPHSPEILSTIQIPCEWTKDPVQTPVFDHYLNDLTMGSDELKLYLVKWVGMIISNIHVPRLKKALFLIGKGNSGKSQLRSLVTRLVGEENDSSASLSQIEARFGTASLYGKRVVGSPDEGFIKIKQLEILKKLTGVNDTIQVEFKGKPSFDYKYRGAVFCCANDFPLFGGDDGDHVYNRLCVLECNNVIPEDKRDSTILEKMYSERQGIVQKAVYSLTDVIQNGFKIDEPEEILQTRTKYKAVNNSAIGFLTDCFINTHTVNADGDGYELLQIQDELTSRKIDTLYFIWCENRNAHQHSRVEFKKIAEKHFGVDAYTKLFCKSGSKRYLENYTLSPEAYEEFRDNFEFKGSFD